MIFEGGDNLPQVASNRRQRLADGGTDCFVPRATFRLWLSNQMEDFALPTLEEHDDRSALEDWKFNHSQGLLDLLV